jgi:hypothetical protein
MNNNTNGDGFRRIEVITGVGRRRRWSDADMARIVAESLDPGTTASAVARRYGLQAAYRAAQAVPGEDRLVRLAAGLHPVIGVVDQPGWRLAALDGHDQGIDAQP